MFFNNNLFCEEPKKNNIKNEIPSYFTEKIVAVVNGEKIFYSELKEKLDSIISASKELQEQSLTEEELKKFEKELLNTLIDNRILVQEAKKLDININPKEIEDYRNFMIVQKLLKEKIEKNISISKEEIENYYKENIKKFEIRREAVLVNKITYKLSENQPEEVKKAKTIMEFLSNLLSEEKTFLLMKDKIQKLNDIIVEEDVFIGIDDISPELRNIILNLKEGEISNLIEDINNLEYQVIYLKKRFKPIILPLNEAAPLIEKELFLQKREDLIKKYVEDLRKESIIQIYD